MSFVIALVLGVVILVAVLNALDRLKRIEQTTARQADMLIALLQKSGINPVTLD